ncbi:disease resistance family protein / LRR family protein, partial [Prunus dulcis]
RQRIGPIIPPHLYPDHLSEAKPSQYLQGHGRCLKLFLAFALLLLQYTQGGEVDHSQRDTNVTIRCIERERQALLAFKRGLVDKSDDLLSSWGSEAQKQDCCRWVGVSCSNQIGHVLQLDLSNEVVGGYFNFRGKFPSQVGNLTNLVYLDLSGSIPDAFGNMSSLAHLDLSYNQLEGSLPDLTNLSSLEVLSLSDNQLSGTSTLIGFPHFQLHSIQLESCKMGPHFPKWLQTQKNISYLYISDAGISDILPSWFWSLCRNVEHMDLARNQIRGTFSKFDIGVKSLQFLLNAPYLDLSSNKLEGPIPSVLSKASYLDLSSNKFERSNKLEGSIPPVLSKASYLDLSSNKLEGPIPSILSKASYLDLSSNKLEGPIPSVLSNVTHLDLSNNKLSSYNALSGKIPTTIGSVFRIETLKLKSNRFVGQLPVSLKNCTSLVVIDVGDNKLSGPIPEWLGVSLKNLLTFTIMPSNTIQNLDFSMNNISGSIPPCLKNLTTLAQKGNSSLTSEHSYPKPSYLSRYNYPNVDDATFMWKRGVQTIRSILWLVKRIDLSSNKLTGEIPSEISHLVGLVSLNLSRNQLTGQITKEIGKLATERIPTSLARIDRLGFLDLSYNNLSGKIPVGTQLQGFDPSFYTGNLQLCGPPLKKDVC